MCFKEFCRISLKVIVAGAAAFAVFIGMGKLVNKETKEPPSEAANVNKESSNPAESKSTEETEKEIQKTSQENGSEKVILNGLRKTQNLFGKLLAVSQSLAMVVESVSRIFKKDYNPSYFNDGYSNMMGNPWNYSQPIQMNNGEVWRRISPYIIEAGPSNGTSQFYGNNNRYPF